jgi:hypothetical protein
MDIQKELQTKINRIRDLNIQLGEISKKIGALQEEGRAIQSKGLELKGAIDFLLELEAKEKKEPKLIWPEKGLLLPAGVVPTPPTPVAPALDAAKDYIDAEVEAELKANPDPDAPLETAEGTLNLNGGN